MTYVIVFFTIVLTSVLSGILGMGGGFILAGVLALILPLQTALLLHAITQLTANGFRSLLNRRAIHWGVVRYYMCGMALAMGVVVMWRINLEKSVFYVILGAVALSAQFVPKNLALDASKPFHGSIAGLLVTFLHLIVGVAGPMLDIFFQKTQLNRFQVVATKSITQTMGHSLRISLYLSLFSAQWPASTLDAEIIFIAILLALLGTLVGTQLLKRVNEQQFKSLSRWLLSSLGALFILKGAVGLYG